MFVYVWYPNRYDQASLFLPATLPISPFQPASLSLPVNPLFPSRSPTNHPYLSFFSKIINVKPLQTEDPTLGIYLGLVKHYWLTLTHISNCPMGRQIVQGVEEGSVVSYHLNSVCGRRLYCPAGSPQHSPNSAEEHGLGSKVMSQVKMQH